MVVFLLCNFRGVWLFGRNDLARARNQNEGGQAGTTEGTGGAPTLIKTTEGPDAQRYGLEN